MEICEVLRFFVRSKTSGVEVAHGTTKETSVGVPERPRFWGSIRSVFGFGFLVACLGNGLFSVAPPPTSQSWKLLRPPPLLNPQALGVVPRIGCQGWGSR